MPRPGGKKFGIKVVMPEGMQCQPVYGAFLIDSFSHMVDRSVGGRKDEYVARMLKGLLQATGYVLDPHTACGVRAAEDLKSQLGAGPVVCLACAHHGKFPAAIEAAGVTAPPEKALTDLLSVPHRKDVLENSARAVIDFVEKTMASRKPAAKKARTA